MGCVFSKSTVATAPPETKSDENTKDSRPRKQHAAPDMKSFASLRTAVSVMDLPSFHQFVQVNEFPVYFDGWPESLTFQGTSALVAVASTNPEYFRFIPVNINDATKGYYLFSSLQRIYAANQWGMTANNDSCVPGTTDVSGACVFYPTFVSPTVMTLQCPAYPNGGPFPWDNPVFLRRTDTSPAPTLVFENAGQGVFDSVTPNIRIPTNATSRPINTTELVYHAWHTFFLFHEFPLYFSGAPTTPVTFNNGDARNDGPVVISSGDNSNPQLLQLVPKDDFDYTQGYYLVNNAIPSAAGSGDRNYNDSKCIPATSNPAEAVLFQVVYVSDTIMKLAAPGYVYPDPGAPALVNPVLVLRMGGDDQATRIMDDNTGGFWNTINLPTTGSVLSNMDRTYSAWHQFFCSSSFPLWFTGTSSLQPSGPGAAAFLIQGTVDVHCNLIPLDTEDYTKGYYIAFPSGQYVGGGTGTYNGAPCVKLVTDVNNADVFLPRVFGELSFVLLNLRTYEALTLSAVAGSTNVTYTSILGASSSDVESRTLTLPSWAVRVMEMAYLSPANVFSLRTNDAAAAYVSLNGNALQLTSTAPTASSSEAYVTPMDMSVLHSGYLLNIGGKYVKLTTANAPVTMVDAIADATPLCIVRESVTTPNYSLWMCDSDLVLSPTADGTGVCFVTQTDTWPLWTFGAVPASDSLRLLGASNTPPQRIDTTTYIKPVFDQLQASHFNSRGNTWNVSFDNDLPADFFIAPPSGLFGKYANMPKATMQTRYPPLPTTDPNQQRANDYFMVPKQASDAPGPANAPVTEIQSSVRFPGDSKIYLAAGHSAKLFESIYQVMISGNHVVDITSLGPFPKEYDPFTAALRNAVTYLSTKPGAENVQIRILFGLPRGGEGRPPESVLRFLTRDVNTMGTAGGSRMKIWFAWAQDGLRWNHTKFVAADGNTAMAGGHNMWTNDYLKGNPVVDVSMKLTGRAASDCQQFADYAWSSFFQRNPNGDGPNMAGCWKWNGTAGSITTGFASKPPDRLFMSFYTDPLNWVGSGRDTGSGTPVLSIARNQDDNFGNAPAETAIIALVAAARTTINISAQSFVNYSSPSTAAYVSYWTGLFNAFAAALVRGVSINIFTSPPGTGSYPGDPPSDLFAAIAAVVSSTPGLNEHDKAATINRLTVQSFPLGTLWKVAANAGVRNHAKMMMVDSTAVLIGSENFYVTTFVGIGGLSEFGFIFEDAACAGLVELYFNQLKNWCQPSPPKPAIPPPPSKYKVTVLALHCTLVSGGWLFKLLPDDVYLYTTDYIWPTPGRNKTKKILNGEGLFVDTVLPIFSADGGEVNLSLYNYQSLDTDWKIAWWTFNKTMLEGKTPALTYTTRGYSIDATYSIDWSYEII